MIDVDDDTMRGHRMYRVAWRFRKSGTTGTSPWVYDRERVEAWFESLSRRFHENTEHWVETAPVEPWR